MVYGPPTTTVFTTSSNRLEKIRESKNILFLLGDMDWGIGGFKGGEGGERLIKMLEIGQKRQFSPYR